MLWLKRLCDYKIIKYGLVGIVNTFTGVSIIFFAKYFLGLNDVLSNLLGYAVGFIISFFLNTKWIFRYYGEKKIVFLKFILVIMVAYLSNLASLMFLINVAGLNSYASQAVSIAPYFFVSFFGCKHFVYK